MTAVISRAVILLWKHVFKNKASVKIEAQAGRPTRKTKRHFFLAKHGFLQKHSAWGQIHCWWRQNKGLSSLKRTYQDLASYTLAFPSCNLPAHKYLREVHRHTHTHIHTHTHTHTLHTWAQNMHIHISTLGPMHACTHGKYSFSLSRSGIPTELFMDLQT